MTYDCFSFFNELDILEIRLNTLNEVVDKFVLVEATRTHSGLPKPLYFEENKQRFAPFLDKIIHVVVDDYPECPSSYSNDERAWVIENHQRNAIIRGFTNAQPDDILTITDADEIPTPEVIKWYHGRHGVRTLKQKLYYYNLNLRNCSIPFWGDSSYGPKILTFRDFCDLQSYQRTNCSNPLVFINQGPTASKVRSSYAPRANVFGGWHFSYVGNIEHIQKKLLSFAHMSSITEDILSADNIKQRIAMGMDISGNGDRLRFEKIDDSFPKYLVENSQKFRDIIAVNNQITYQTKCLLLLIYTRGTIRDFVENNILAPCRPFYGPVKKIIGV